MGTVVDAVVSEVRELVRRRGLDPFADLVAMRQLVDEVVNDDENPGRFIVEAVLDDPGVVTVTRPVLPLDGGPGGWPEHVIPDAPDHVTVRGVGGYNEPWTRPPGTWEP